MIAPASPGVYLIRNINNGKAYVGSSVNLRSRWYTHKHGLRSGGHSNQKLQRAWDKHGEASFEFVVLEVCLLWSTEIQWEKEARWIAELSPEYNILPVAGSRLGYRQSDEWKNKQAAIKAAENACFDKFWKMDGWLFHCEGISYYAWDASDSVLSSFGISNGESYRSGHPKPDNVLASRTTSRKEKRYVLAGKIQN